MSMTCPESILRALLDSHQSLERTMVLSCLGLNPDGTSCLEGERDAALAWLEKEAMGLTEEKPVGIELPY